MREPTLQPYSVPSGTSTVRPGLTCPLRGSSVGLVACSVVCVSYTTGSGGDEVGRRVAEELGHLYVDEDIVANAAAQGGLEPRDIADEERRKSFARRSG